MRGSNIEQAVFASVLIGLSVVIDDESHAGTLDIVVAVKAGPAPYGPAVLIFNDDRERVLNEEIADLYIEEESRT